MNSRGTFLTVAASVFVSVISTPGEAPKVNLSRKGSGLEFSWPGAMRGEDGSVVRPFFELQRSADLQRWNPVGERMRNADATAADLLSVTVGADEGYSFYRLRAFEPRISKLVEGGEEVFGFSEAFATELARMGQISVEEFEETYSRSASYLPKLSWDPTTARFWTDFNADPAVLNQGKRWGEPGYRLSDYRLNPTELAVFKNNGFVVSERLGAGWGNEGDSFADVFYTLWYNDLPVFISTDAILQAWHRTYDSMLEEIEETYLFNSLEQMLREMALRVPLIAAEASEGVLKESVRDIDYFLTVARSLLDGNPIASSLGEDARVQETLDDVRALQLKRTTMFGECRVVDFSQFKVRGHYEHTPRLYRYFQCVMWLGRTDFVVAGGPFRRCPDVESYASPREIGAAIVLWDLLHRAGEFESWLRFDQIIQAFVGWTDSLNFAQLGSLLAGAGIRSVHDVPALARLQDLQQEIIAGNLGVQHIRSDFFASPLGAQQIQLPRAFLFMGQKFVPDSWAFAKVVYDDVLWVEGGVTNRIQRRVPSALDMAFSVLQNDQIVPELVARMNNTAARGSAVHAEKWRDGFPYQHNLAAVRNIMDSQETGAWTSNIYMSWLNTLRELSAPTTDAIFPETLRTRAWAMKTLNTQLASWTQLRHDTVLYAKQSYTGFPICYYPEGYVEPRVEFWRALADMAERAASLIENLPYSGTYRFVTSGWEGSGPDSKYVTRTNVLGLAEIKSRQVAHLRKFAATVSRLEKLSRKELAQECFDQEDDVFIKNLIQQVGTVQFGCSSLRKYDGWYPQLFYRGVQFERMSESDFQENYGANAGDRIVTDVHTDLPAPAIGDEGSVLHEGIGPANLLMIAVESGPDRAVYAGPVLSHFEFEVTGEPKRLSDTDWEGFYGGFVMEPIDPNRIQGRNAPSWTRSYLVPRQ
jgi:hypothetical protein